MIIMIIKTKYIYCNLSQWLTFTENCLLEARYKKKKKKKNCLSVLISKINDHHLKIKFKELKLFFSVTKRHTNQFFS